MCLEHEILLGWILTWFRIQYNIKHNSAYLAFAVSICFKGPLCLNSASGYVYDVWWYAAFLNQVKWHRLARFISGRVLQMPYWYWICVTLQSDHLSLEKLLVHTIQVRSTAKLKDLEREFCCHVPGKCKYHINNTVLWLEQYALMMA